MKTMTFKLCSMQMVAMLSVRLHGLQIGSENLLKLWRDAVKTFVEWTAHVAIHKECSSKLETYYNVMEILANCA